MSPLNLRPLAPPPGFVGGGWRMQGDLEPAWLEPTAQLFIGVQSVLETAQCVDLLTKVGQLDMKVGSSDRVEDIYTHGTGGLRFAHIPLLDQRLPKIADR